MSLDIRIPIGLLFAIIGVLLAVFGLASDPELYVRSRDINVNLWWGLAMTVFGLGMLAVPRRSAGELRALLWLVSLVMLGGIAFGAYLVVVPQKVTQYTDVYGQRWPEGAYPLGDVYPTHGMATRDGQRIGQWTAYWPKKEGDHEGQAQIREQGEYARHESGIGTAKDGIWRQWDREGNLVGRCEFRPVLEKRSKAVAPWMQGIISHRAFRDGGLPPTPDAVISWPIKGCVAFFTADGEIARLEVIDLPEKDAAVNTFPGRLSLWPTQQIRAGDPDFQKTLDALRAADESEPACCP